MDKKGTMKRFAVLLSVASLCLGICSCDKEPVVDEHIISRPYYLCEYTWEGPGEIDVNDNGVRTNDLFRDMSLWGKESVFHLYFPYGNNASSGTCMAEFPTVSGRYPSSFQFGSIAFDYWLKNDRISFLDTPYMVVYPEDSSQELSDLYMTYYEDALKDDTRYVVISAKARFFDYATGSFVDGQVALKYVSAPQVSMWIDFDKNTVHMYY